MEEFLSTIGRLVAVIFLLLLNGFFVAAEFAIVRVRGTTVEKLLKRGSRRARILDHLVKHLDAYLSACQLGVTIASILLGWVGEETMRRIFVEPVFRAFSIHNETVMRWTSFFFGTGLVVYLHVVVGELAPKSLAIRKAEPTAMWIAYPLYLFDLVFKPAIALLNRSSDALLRLFGIQPVSGEEMVHTLEELRMLVAASERSGVLPTEKHDLLENVFELSSRTVRQIMVPRTEVAFFNIQKPLAYNLMIAEQTAHSRYPLVDGDLDHVLGIVHMKDLFWQMKDLEAIAAGQGEPEYRNPMIAGGDLEANPPASGAEFLKHIARETFFVPETMRIDALLREFQQRRLHMAIVVDEYGGTAGLVTFENVIEAIVGQIQDEFDQEAPRIRQIGEREYLVDGVTLLDEVNDALGTTFTSEEVDTIGGLLLNALGRMPKAGDSVTIDGVELIVSEMRQHRIHRVHVKLPPPETPEADQVETPENTEENGNE
ncbi:MAG: hemolysin family protein [Candidatus Sumerlaea chitinivorans]|nr:hemolysin family protein [Candidatus Sumerlaea chitinivorans]